MQIGAVYPQIELRGDPASVRTFGTSVEELGFDYLLAYDHVLGAVHADRTPKLVGPYTENDPFHDPFVMFAYLAGITERLEFASGVLILPQRQTTLVARQAADVDLLSGGRLRLGVGVGWNYVEYEALGQDFRTRGRREEEQIELLRRLFTEPVVDFSGQFDRVDRAALIPRPTGNIPIWLGGFGDVVFDRAARIGDGFIFVGPPTKIIANWNQLRDRLAELDRPVANFGGELILQARDSVAKMVDDFGAWREAGGTHVSIDTMGRGHDSVAAHLEVQAEVLAAIRAA
jgi:probable F420-dependent oxidoreductase